MYLFRPEPFKFIQINVKVEAKQRYIAVKYLMEIVPKFQSQSRFLLEHRGQDYSKENQPG